MTRSNKSNQTNPAATGVADGGQWVKRHSGSGSFVEHGPKRSGSVRGRGADTVEGGEGTHDRDHATVGAGVGGLVGAMVGSFAGPVGAVVGGALGAGLGAAVGSEAADPGPHAGEHLADALEGRGITAYRLAKDIGVTQPAISGILHGTRSITAQMALRFARYFGTSPEFWMNLQVGYDLAKARAEFGAEVARIVPLPPPEGQDADEG